MKDVPPLRAIGPTVRRVVIWLLSGVAVVCAGGCGKSLDATDPGGAKSAPTAVPTLGLSCASNADCVPGARCSEHAACELEGPCWGHTERGHGNIPTNSVTRYDYDAKGRVVAVERRDSDGKLVSRMERAISDEGRRIEQWGIRVKDGPDVRSKFTTLDQQHRLLEQVTHFHDFGGKMRLVYHYASSSRCKAASGISAFEGDEQVPSSRAEIDCNDRGQRIEQRWFKKGGLAQRIEFEYDAAHRLSGLRIENHRPTTWEGTSHLRLVRDQRGFHVGTEDDVDGNGRLDIVQRWNNDCWRFDGKALRLDRSKLEPRP